MKTKAFLVIAASIAELILWAGCGGGTTRTGPDSGTPDSSVPSLTGDGGSMIMDAGAGNGGAEGETHAGALDDAGFADAGTYVVLGGTVSFHNNGFPETYDSDAGNEVAGKYRRNTVPGTDRFQIQAHQSDAFSADGISLDIEIADGAVESCFLVGYYAPVNFLGDCKVQLDELNPAAGTISGTFTGRMSQETCCSTLFPEYMDLDGGTLVLRVAPQ